MQSRRFVRPPVHYTPPAKPLSFHRNVFQGTIHREKIFTNFTPNSRENYLFHRDAFQPLANVIPTRMGEESWPCITSSYGRPDTIAESLGWFVMMLVCCTMIALSLGTMSASDETKNVKAFESSLVEQRSRVIGADLLGLPKKATRPI